MADFEAGKEIISLGSTNNTFYIIANGSVISKVRGHEITIKKGDIVGIFDITMPVHTCKYTAAENCSLIPYSFEGKEGLLALLDRNSDLRKLFILSSWQCHLAQGAEEGQAGAAHLRRRLHDSGKRHGCYDEEALSVYRSDLRNAQSVPPARISLSRTARQSSCGGSD